MEDIVAIREIDSCPDNHRQNKRAKHQILLIQLRIFGGRWEGHVTVHRLNVDDCLLRECVRTRFLGKMYMLVVTIERPCAQDLLKNLIAAGDGNLSFDSSDGIRLLRLSVRGVAEECQHRDQAEEKLGGRQIQPR